MKGDLMDKTDEKKTSLSEREVELVSLAVSATVKELLPVLLKNEKKECQCSKKVETKDTFDDKAAKVEKEIIEIANALAELERYTDKLCAMTRRNRDPLRAILSTMV